MTINNRESSREWIVARAGKHRITDTSLKHRDRYLVGICTYADRAYTCTYMCHGACVLIMDLIMQESCRLLTRCYRAENGFSEMTRSFIDRSRVYVYVRDARNDSETDI